MIDPRSTFYAMKVGFAHSWWAAASSSTWWRALPAILAAVTESPAAMRGIARIESMLILLLLLETLIHRLTHHLPMEAPTVADVVAGCMRLACGWWCIVVAADASCSARSA